MDLQYMVHKYIHIAIILCVRELQLNFKVILVYGNRYNIVLYEMICCGHCDFFKTWLNWPYYSRNLFPALLSVVFGGIFAGWS